ncbi:MAG: exo-alpha-sialidase [Prolixibacteraceae bacterium]|nr:exo-alpha-sialidase [Prolixibacteraceae bacterium]MBT6767230.1 exo-alpha-sialidase [Prolixibacteraceae bacterium]MBT7394170.1 exo-alpha-sialidase [Prolixibacteraceae bacterium]
MNKLLIIVALVLTIASCNKSENPTIATLGFENCEPGDVTEINENGIQALAAPGNIRIYPKKGKTTPNSLHIVGGENKTLELINTTGKTAKYLSFFAESWTSKPPFQFKVEVFDGVNWRKLYNGDEDVKTGNFSKEVFVTLPDTKAQRIRLTSTSAESGGVLIDDITFFSDEDMVIDSVSAPYRVYPVLKGKSINPVLNIQVYSSGFSNAQKLEEITLNTLENDFSGTIKNVEVFYTGKNPQLIRPVSFGAKKSNGKTLSFNGSQELTHGVNHFFVSCELEENAEINSNVSVQCLSVKINGKEYPVKAGVAAQNYLGIALRQHNDDDVDTYRIPGLATTNKGTLIGVYDIRYNSGVDLQEDVDVGMHRSTDSGKTWEPMKVIMDMKEWGGLPNDQNGIGDPSVLVDRETNTIWVAAVWAYGHPGQRNWWASRPGLEPKTTSQFVLVKSEDDGVTWSEPINITKQIKQPEWYLLLQGPGKGITLKDGTLVFPAQFKDKNDMPHSTIISSKDHGKNWTIGTGAKSNTTEAQVIELNDGGLMLNMRDNRNGSDKSETNGRAVAVTYDMGKTWKTHSTSNGALQEPTCMASLIKEEFIVDGEKKILVLFSNPNSKFGRHHMTIKVSLDDGETWPEKHQLLIDFGGGRGYSCMTKVDDKHVGILYEGSQADLIFQVFSVDDILKGNLK